MDYPSLNTLHLDPLPSCLGAVQDRRLHQKMDAAVKMMFLRQGTHSIEDYVVDFLELAHMTHLDEICLIIFFRGGLSEPLSSIMPLHDPNWTLENYVDMALQLSGSPFTVGIAEEENNSPQWWSVTK